MEREVEQKNRMVHLANLTDDQRMDVLNALKKLAGKATLLQAAEFFVLHNDLPAGATITIEEAADRYIKAAHEDGLRSIQDIQMAALRKKFGARPVAHISRSDADEWFMGLHQGSGRKYSARSKRHFRTVVGGLFNWCIEKGYSTQNPFAALSRGRRGKKVNQDQFMPGILTVSQVQALLFCAQAEAPALVPALALAFFAGLRTNELRQREWRDILFEHRLLKVRPEIAKKRQARNVEMQPNLMAWLLPYRCESGFMAPQGSEYRSMFDRVRKLAKCFAEYPQNGARHTFATMHLQQYQDAAKTALQLGHVGGTGILFDHYRALATPQEAEMFWQIKPKADVQVARLTAAVSA
ncbi:MAG: site-specific integrase [Kiritimatiellaeota bacterium]|nr:site-specific integrase [Kiritimatiellota bacterium]